MKNPNVSYTGEVLRLLRVISGQGQGELAEQANISGTFICEIEIGRKMPSLRTIEQLCNTFGLPMSSFLRLVERAKELGILQFRAEILARVLEEGK